MLTKYIKAAMHKAVYEILPDDGTFYGEIPECRGVWANEKTLEACRDELQAVLEDWLLLGIYLQHQIPIIDGIDLNIKPGTVQEEVEEDLNLAVKEAV